MRDNDNNNDNGPTTTTTIVYVLLLKIRIRTMIMISNIRTMRRIVSIPSMIITLTITRTTITKIGKDNNTIKHALTTERERESAR